MSEATVDSAPHARSGKPLARHWAHGLRGLVRFMTHPNDLANSFDAMFSLAGPTVQREFDRFAASPVGRRLLAEAPRRDLNRLLTDHAKLRAMPEGSFAAAYLDYLGGEDMGSAAYFLEAADLEGAAARFGWSDDHLWFVRRMANSHDLFHILAGYDRDVTGEVGVIAFTAGQLPLLPVRLLLPFFAILRPARLFAWIAFMARSYRHGKETPSLACVDYEALLPMPLEDARRAIGMRAYAEVHGDRCPGPGSWLRGLEARVELV